MHLILYFVMIFSSKKIYQYSKADTGSIGGFTLIEVLLALTIFSIGILAVLTLSDANVRLAKENADRVLAANLAREGVELVRNLRDSNWLKIENNQTDCGSGNICPWDYHLHAEDNSGFFAIDYDYENTGILTGASCNSWDSCLNSDVALGKIYLNKTTGYYSHQPSGKATNFSRIIKIQNICLSTIDHLETPRGTECIDGTEEKIGLVVTARVRRQTHGKIVDFDATEHLYDWRY